MIRCTHCDRLMAERIKGPTKLYCGSVCRGRARNVRNSTGRPGGRPPAVDPHESKHRRRERVLAASRDA